MKVENRLKKEKVKSYESSLMLYLILKECISFPSIKEEKCYFISWWFFVAWEPNSSYYSSEILSVDT